MNFGPVTYESNLPALGRSIRAYIEVYTKKEAPAILEDQANKLSCFGVEGAGGLFQESAATTPTADALTALPPAIGWRVRRHKGPRPIFTEGYALQSYKRGARAGQYRVDKRGRIVHKLIGVEGEMDRRIRARLFQAAGWLSPRLGKYASGAATGSGQKNDRAIVTLVLTGPELSVTITNVSPAALEVAERTGYMTRVVVNRIQDLDTYTQRKWGELVDQLNAITLPG